MSPQHHNHPELLRFPYKASTSQGSVHFDSAGHSKRGAISKQKKLKFLINFFFNASVVRLIPQ
jgi:hypothetical protein